jgi:hypothetical protein
VPTTAAATAAAATDSQTRPSVTRETCLGDARAVSAAIVFRNDLDVVVIPAAVCLAVFDAQVREVHFVIEVREIVVARPFANLFGPAISESA